MSRPRGKFSADPPPAPRVTLPVLGVPIDVVNQAEAVRRIADWGSRRESRVVCICNVHSVVTATRDPALQAALSRADMATPDGAPVAWMLRRQGAAGQQRVSGPDLMLAYCAHAAATGEPIFLYGSTTATLDLLQQHLHERWPALHIAGALSPPFRALSPAEEDEIRATIHRSGARTVWVGLGCPKQELWMSRQRGQLNAVMLGVGAAFDFHAGTMPRAPRWMQQYGLEWLHRLASDPRRLWRRYLVTNTLFIVAVVRGRFGRAP